MSARRGWVLALERHRRAVARELAALELGANIICANCTGTGIDFDADCNAEGCENRPLGSADSGFTAHHAGPNCESTCTLCEGTGSGRAALALALLTDQRQGFDVHAAREHARALIAKGLDLTTGPEHDVWSDWRMYWAGKNRTPDECPATASGHGGQYARLGQRILDMLEGQPSDEWAYAYTMGERDRLEGLGWAVGEWSWVGEVKLWPMSRHNLRGKLPEVEWRPAVRRKASDALTAMMHREAPTRPDQWWEPAMEAARSNGFELTRVDPDTGEIVRDARTRVCPRGEHRTDLDLGGGDAIILICTLDQRITAKGWTPVWYRHGPSEARHMPAWRRGEIEHARQRREREARREEGLVRLGDAAVAATDAWRGYDWTATLVGGVDVIDE